MKRQFSASDFVRIRLGASLTSSDVECCANPTGAKPYVQHASNVITICTNVIQ